MDVKTYRARSMHEALQLVRRDLGPEAAVLRTREIGTGMLGWLRGGRQIEVLASGKMSVPSRLQKPAEPSQQIAAQYRANIAYSPPESARFVAELDSGLDLELEGKKRVKHLAKPTPGLGRLPRSRKLPPGCLDLPDALLQVYSDLIESEFHEEVARSLIEDLYENASKAELAHCGQLRLRLARMIEAEIAVAGEIDTSAAARRIVALVGPTGVGKTTTIAKLAANFRLRQQKQVGLVTVDTYRIAAVEQLRTYADIMDLPMEVVSTPREMCRALARMSDLDLVLMDTAGRSPHDEVRVRELRTMLAEARADEVHLVLSSAASGESLMKNAAQFAGVGTTALILTKLDESTGLGNLLPLLQSRALPLSYVTHGQNVPDDIAPAQACELARRMLTATSSMQSGRMTTASA